jgi:Spy/CpxP family protein refolding chaperone
LNITLIKTKIMKKSGIKMMLLITAISMGTMFSGSNAAFAQGQGRGQGPGPDDDKGACRAAIPGLTEEQQNSIEKLRVKHIRKAELIRAEIGEKQARMNTLRLAEKSDEKAIDRTIDEISKLRGDLMKEREAHQREIKALLNDDQQVFFDARRDYGRNGNGYKHQGKNGRGMGYRPGNRGDCPYRN